MYHRRSWFSCTPSLQTWHAKSSRLRGWMASANRMNSAEYMHIAVVIFGEIISGGFFVSARPCRRAVEVSRTPVGVVSKTAGAMERRAPPLQSPSWPRGPRSGLSLGRSESLCTLSAAVDGRSPSQRTCWAWPGSQGPCFAPANRAGGSTPSVTQLIKEACRSDRAAIANVVCRRANQVCSSKELEQALAQTPCNGCSWCQRMRVSHSLRLGASTPGVEDLCFG